MMRIVHDGVPANPETMANDDAAQVAALRGGDEAAYDAFVRAHGPRLLAVARRILGGSREARDGDAEDAVQEAFVQAFKAIDRFAFESKLTTWLHRIVVNQALMKLRARRRHPELPIDDLQPRFLADGHHVEPPVAWREEASIPAAEREETRSLVRLAIAALPPAYRDVVMLRDIEGLSTEEAARRLGDGVNAVKIRLHRARLALRAALDARMRKGDL
jgi:RNA polymerase sigma-70 factor (ECF subfamily)